MMQERIYADSDGRRHPSDESDYHPSAKTYVSEDFHKSEIEKLIADHNAMLDGLRDALKDGDNV